MILSVDTPAPRISQTHLDRILGNYTPRQQKIIFDNLTEEGLKIIDDTCRLGQDIDPIPEYLLVARANRLVSRKEKFSETFTRFVPKDFHHFVRTQLPWLAEEERLVHERLPPDVDQEIYQAALSEDFNRNKNGPRFKAYYRLKFSNKVNPY